MVGEVPLSVTVPLGLSTAIFETMMRKRCSLSARTIEYGGVVAAIVGTVYCKVSPMVTSSAFVFNVLPVLIVRYLMLRADWIA